MLSTAALPAAAPAAVGPTPAGRHLALLSAKRVREDVTRYHYRYGLLEAMPGQNFIMLGPERMGTVAPEEGFMTRVKPNLVREDGTPPFVDDLHMHHAVLLNLNRRDPTAPNLPGERFFGFAEEKTIGELPAPYGYRIDPNDAVGVNYMLHNGSTQSQSVYIDLELDFVAKASALGQTMKAARPLWIDVQNGSAYPVFDVHRGSGAGGRFTYPTKGAYGDGPAKNEWTVDRDGLLVAGAGHLHPGGLWVDLSLRRGTAEALLFRSTARYFDPGGPLSWDMAMEVPPPDWRIAVRKGDVLSVSTTYDSAHASWYESMGIFFAYLADEGPGADPFGTHSTTGEPTHGPLPEAGRHGGEPTGLPDAGQLTDGQPIAGGVGIGNFLYTPGDLSADGDMRNPPTVQPGTTITFGNFDAAFGILHTITACRAPCNRRTGVSYPLADGSVDFDSGQLGYGPPGATAAAQHPEWRTPADLRPGTYTYFCRVHPFMRGAFRIAGAVPTPSSGSAPESKPKVKRGPLLLAARIRGRTLRVRVACHGDGTCRGSLSATTDRGRRLGSRRYAVRGGRSSWVTLALSRPEARVLRRARRVTLIARPSGGGPALRRRMSLRS